MSIIGGSRGGREGRTPPPGRPNSFDFMQFSGKFGVFTPPLEGSRPPLGKILDPPLSMVTRVLTLPCVFTKGDISTCAVLKAQKIAVVGNGLHFALKALRSACI